jgi:golgi-specific brefeldin A-resistance guanine nucleotide exchange factor 1
MKNILLVMQSGGYLAPPTEKPEQAELWNETWKRLNRFLPNLYKELYPDEPVSLPTRSASVKGKGKDKEDDKKEGGSGSGEIVEKGKEREGESSEDGEGEGDVKTSVGTFVKS